MRTFLRDARGDTIIEFALASMLFFITVFGIMEFGQAVWRYNLVANLAKEGARRAIVCGKNTSLSRSTDCNIQTYVRSRAFGMTVTATTNPSGLANLTGGQSVSVHVQHTFTPLTTLIPHTALNLNSTSTMIVAR